MNASETAAVIVVVLVLLVGAIVVGAQATNSAITNDCDKLGRTVINDVAYECKRLPESAP